MDATLSGRVALVTGGAIRVGKAIAETLANAGATLAIHHWHSVEAAERLRSDIVARGGRAELFRYDLTAPGAPAALAQDVATRLGAVSILVNSAAGFERAPFLDTSEAVLDAQWALNLRAPYLLTQALARGMLARGAGDIVNVLDVHGAFRPAPNYSAYVLTKAALTQLTQTLALELAPHVRVNGVAPGAVLPPETYSAEAVERLRQRVPQKCFGGAEAVADAVRFFVTGPKFVTGQVLAVDGGEGLLTR